MPGCCLLAPLTELAVPTDVLVYTEDEWRSLPRQGRFYLTVMRECIWVWVGGDSPKECGENSPP